MFINHHHLLHPGRLTAGTYSHHPWKERKMIWTKQSSIIVFQPLIFRGVARIFQGRVTGTRGTSREMMGCFRYLASESSNRHKLSGWIPDILIGSEKPSSFKCMEMVIYNPFQCKDVVHHLIEMLPFKENELPTTPFFYMGMWEMIYNRFSYNDLYDLESSN